MSFKSVEEIRIASGLSQSQLAKEIGISSRSYQNKIYGLTDWKIQELYKIASYNDYKIKVDELEISFKEESIV